MERYIVLDVDRTIINGTSWYYACTCPDLLIRKQNIDMFKDLNEQLFNHGTTSDKEKFRLLTFDLIEKVITKESIDILNEQGCGEQLTKEEPIDNYFLSCIGRYTIKKLVTIDEYCKKTISLIHKYYTGNVKVLFLTSGYASFMNGLLSAYMEGFQEQIVWEVIGTDVRFDNGRPVIDRLITQHQKYNIVNQMISEHKKIVFLADDSTEDMRLFQVVGENHGYAFNVQYDRINHSLNWREFYEKVTNKDFLLQYLLEKSEIRLDKNTSFIDEFYVKHCNEIGVLQLTQEEYNEFCKQIQDEVLCGYIHELVHIKSDVVYLRGRVYYFWLPPYINMSLKSKYSSWKKLYNLGYHMIHHMSKVNHKDSRYTELLVYMACDHLLAALYLAIYCMQKQGLKGNHINVNNYQDIQRAIFLINNIMDSILSGKARTYKLQELDSILRLVDISELDIIDESDKFLMELDNYVLVFATAKSIVKNLGEKIDDIDSIVCFAYGGMALGYAVQSLISSSLHRMVELYTSHYSSKRFTDIDIMMKQIMPINQKSICDTNSTLLLVDNNATTFKTLKDAKEYLIKRGNKIYCAVAEVDYNNVCKWILGDETCEPMCDNWYEVVEVLPLERYITAYNTWGTSRKSQLLEIMFSSDLFQWNLDKSDKQPIFSKHRKICRVHNIYDLQVAQAMGATMIGIHAVISHKNDYYDEPKMSGIEIKRYSELPVADYEIEGIRYMVSHMPSHIMPVLVIENQLSIEQINQILEIYGMDVTVSGIQFQFLTDASYIDSIIEMGFARVIVSVGIVQHNIAGYLNSIIQSLRKTNDMVLIDMSKHQPQLIEANAEDSEYNLEFDNKFSRLHTLISALKDLNLSILLADDMEPDRMIECQMLLLANGVHVVGLDMQNNIELTKAEQGYCRIQSENKYYYAKIRKSIDKIKKWKLYESVVID